MSPDPFLVGGAGHETKYGHAASYCTRWGHYQKYSLPLWCNRGWGSLVHKGVWPWD